MIIGLEDHLSIEELYRTQCAVRRGIIWIVARIGYSPTVRDQIEERGGGDLTGKGLKVLFDPLREGRRGYGAVRVWGLPGLATRETNEMLCGG